MSGVEIAVAAAAATSLVASGVSAYSQVQTANETQRIQADNIREEQLQLRLQQNQNSIERMKKLQQVLATEEISFGLRNIAPGSGSARAVTIKDVSNFYEDENADRLNFGAKQLALARQGQLNRITRNATVFNAYTGLVKEGANTVISAYGCRVRALLARPAQRVRLVGTREQH